MLRSRAKTGLDILPESADVLEQQSDSVQQLLEQLQLDPEQNGLAKVSVIGSGIRGQPGVAATMFRTLSDHGINIEMISTSEVRITCIIDAKRAKDAVAALHEAFKL